MPDSVTLKSVRRVWAVLAVVPLLAACTGVSAGAGASCVSPYLDDQDPHGTYGAPAATATAGGVLTVYGHWYTSTCIDTNHGKDDPEPLRPVRLTLTLPDSSVHDLGSFTPTGEDSGFHVVVRVPRTTVPGSASIRDNREPSAVHRFTVDAPS